jgi:hypothetical protein
MSTASISMGSLGVTLLEPEWPEPPPPPQREYLALKTHVVRQIQYVAIFAIGLTAAAIYFTSCEGGWDKRINLIGSISMVAMGLFLTMHTETCGERVNFLALMGKEDAPVTTFTINRPIVARFPQAVTNMEFPVTYKKRGGKYPYVVYSATVVGGLIAMAGPVALATLVHMGECRNELAAVIPCIYSAGGLVCVSVIAKIWDEHRVEYARNVAECRLRESIEEVKGKPTIPPPVRNTLLEMWHRVKTIPQQARDRLLLDWCYMITDSIRQADLNFRLCRSSSTLEPTTPKSKRETS